MNTNFFAGCSTVEQIKSTYRQWAFKLHPDHGGDLEQMKELNLQYERTLKNANGQTSVDSEGKEHVYRYNESIENELVEILFQLLSLKMQDVDLLLIGSWVWVVGDTKPHKDQLKNLKCRWHSQRSCWYYRSAKSRCFSQSSGDLSELAQKYGCTNVKEVNQKSTRKTGKKALR